jgi:hypothetical protein
MVEPTPHKSEDIGSTPITTTIVEMYLGTIGNLNGYLNLIESKGHTIINVQRLHSSRLGSHIATDWLIVYRKKT